MLALRYTNINRINITVNQFTVLKRPKIVSIDRLFEPRII